MATTITAVSYGEQDGRIVRQEVFKDLIIGERKLTLDVDARRFFAWVGSLNATLEKRITNHGKPYHHGTVITTYQWVVGTGGD